MNKVSIVMRKMGDPQKARLLAGFFKTGPGEYAEGDKFWGLTVPQTRQLAHEYAGITLPEVVCLLHSEMHEERLLALLILIRKFEQGDGRTREQVYKLYLANTRFINNWDLVDLSAPQIVGGFLLDRTKDRRRDVLLKLARSTELWERRIAILATFAFIKDGDCRLCLEIAGILLHDKHDLIHKAVGWMLRETGKRCSREEEEGFLRTHYQTMPRTMLRYAIERFPEALRQKYLQGKIS